jgi:hypothetical protein
LVERVLAKHEVVGSKPITRSMKKTQSVHSLSGVSVASRSEDLAIACLLTRSLS